MHGNSATDTGMDTDTLSLLIISLPPPLLCQTDGACKVRAASGLSAIRELNSNIRGITTIFRTIMTFLADKWGYDPQSLWPCHTIGGSLQICCSAGTERVSSPLASHSKR